MFELGIEDLGEVLRILREHFFKSTDYFDLGLDLGLLYDTIDTIKSHYREDPKSCLRECLVKWLEKADKVKEKGGPTWYTLIEALRSINKAVADAIDKESKMPVFSFLILIYNRASSLCHLCYSFN